MDSIIVLVVKIVNVLLGFNRLEVFLLHEYCVEYTFFQRERDVLNQSNVTCIHETSASREAPHEHIKNLRGQRWEKVNVCRAADCSLS